MPADLAIPHGATATPPDRAATIGRRHRLVAASPLRHRPTAPPPPRHRFTVMAGRDPAIHAALT
jgi:hypothetical protein